jgi:hypothetical protein
MSCSKPCASVLAGISDATRTVATSQCLHRDDLDFVVFCFGKPQDARVLERFGGALPDFLASGGRRPRSTSYRAMPEMATISFTCPPP